MRSASRLALILLTASALALAGCAGGGGELTSGERHRADAAFTTLTKSCKQVASATVRVHNGFQSPADRRRHAAEGRAVDVLLALHSAKPHATYAPPGDRAQPLPAVLGELSKQILFCDSTLAAKISQALDHRS